MADVLTDGNTRVAYAPTISNIAAPTTTELNAGILLQSVLTADGLVNFESSTDKVDNTALNSKFSTAVPGRPSFGDTRLRLKKQASGDTAYSTLITATAGYIVIRRDVAETTAWTSTQPVEVYPIICGEVSLLPPDGGNQSVRKYEVPVIISAQPNLRAVVA
ncbi:MAG TPA: hypothetical protein VL652_34680 [Kutzneria sp.]|nr:hypothetical protein [Kutzneria sp.]